MQDARESTVLGNFNQVSFTHFDLTSTFFQRDGKYYANTEGPDGQLSDFEIRYTFGVYPLQQYLVAFPGGRYQVLNMAWDSRSDEQGGQRWFHLYPDERIPPGDVLHWTEPLHRWNYMCASCHSTNLKKGYDVETDQYTTSWSEVDVSCEACHGPASQHLEWANAGEEEKVTFQDKGLLVPLGEAKEARWEQDASRNAPRRHPPLQGSVQVETCARCHARRTSLSEDDLPGHPLLNAHRPALLEENLYYADGQMQDEVYVYGSFIQSKMYGAGVVCTDCHEAHSLELKAPGNSVCSRCHLSTTFDVPTHHHHLPESEGARCVDCHMPERIYMGVDPRRDHSLRIPRPDLSQTLGTPNACNQCHENRSAEWAADKMVEWYGIGWKSQTHYGETLHMGRSGGADAESSLVQVAGDVEQPAIARATALSLLGKYGTPAARQTIRAGLLDKDGLLRLAALNALGSEDSRSWFEAVYPLLSDSLGSVRIEAARVLAPLPAHEMTEHQRSLLEEGLGEYEAAQLLNADRPEAHLNLGLLYASQGRLDRAENAYRSAIKRAPWFTQAYINLADLYRVQGRDDEGERLLREALAIQPDEPVVYHVLGLLLVRKGRTAEAVEALGKAVALRPDNLRFSYVYGVALHSIGTSNRAVDVLEQAYRRHPRDRELLRALVTINLDRGANDAALKYVRELIALAPEDPELRRILEQIQAGDPQ
ncbi:MAG: tetratricopeptide repeat protein [Rhodothermales bacterium]